jgi:hypothetical protein
MFAPSVHGGFLYGHLIIFFCPVPKVPQILDCPVKPGNDKRKKPENILSFGGIAVNS